MKREDKGLGRLIDPQVSKDYYHTPEDYFKGLTDRIMGQIPETHERELLPQVSLWQKIKPALYLAASFLMIYLGMELTQIVQSEVAQPEPVMARGGQEADMHQCINDSDYERFFQEYSQRIVSKDYERALSGLDNRI